MFCEPTDVDAFDTQRVRSYSHEVDVMSLRELSSIVIFTVLLIVVVVCLSECTLPNGL